MCVLEQRAGAAVSDFWPLLFITVDSIEYIKGTLRVLAATPMQRT